MQQVGGFFFDVGLHVAKHAKEAEDVAKHA